MFSVMSQSVINKTKYIRSHYAVLHCGSSPKLVDNNANIVTNILRLAVCNFAKQTRQLDLNISMENHTDFLFMFMKKYSYIGTYIFALAEEAHTVS